MVIQNHCENVLILYHVRLYESLEGLNKENLKNYKKSQLRDKKS